MASLGKTTLAHLTAIKVQRQALTVDSQPKSLSARPAIISWIKPRHVRQGFSTTITIEGYNLDTVTNVILSTARSDSLWHVSSTNHTLTALTSFNAFVSSNNGPQAFKPALSALYPQISGYSLQDYRILNSKLDSSSPINDWNVQLPLSSYANLSYQKKGENYLQFLLPPCDGSGIINVCVENNAGRVCSLTELNSTVSAIEVFPVPTPGLYG